MVLMSDEAHFHLNGAVNKQNCRYWAAENPREIHQKPLHSPKAVSYTHLDVYKRQVCVCVCLWQLLLFLLMSVH